MKQVLVLGVGNTLMADDGIGPAAIAMLEQNWSFPQNVTLTDGGTKGTYLLPLVMDCSHLMIIDAIDLGCSAGTIHQLDHNDLQKIWARQTIGTHDASIPELLSYCELLDSKPEEIRAIGIQPASTDLSPVQLSEPVAKALPQICNMAIKILEGWGMAANREKKAQSDEREDMAVPRFAEANV